MYSSRYNAASICLQVLLLIISRSEGFGRNDEPVNKGVNVTDLDGCLRQCSPATVVSLAEYTAVGILQDKEGDKVGKSLTSAL